MTQQNNKPALPNKDSADQTDQTTVKKSASMILDLLKEGTRLTRAQKAAVISDLYETSSPNTDYFVLVILSCTIATLGLIVNSPAVIIGAMLVAPLMSPILGLSMASISGQSGLFKHSGLAILEGFGSAVALSALLAFLTYRLPHGDLARIPSEVLARTNPSLLDLGIALAGGAAAAYALAHPKLSAALPGVAIATALMPPICTIGIGISMLDGSIILGALLLFLTNLAAISFSGIITFALMGFSPRRVSEQEETSRNMRISALLVLIISIPLGIFAYNSLNEARMVQRTSAAVLASIPPAVKASLVELYISSQGDTKNIEVVLRTSKELTHAEVVAMQSDIADQLQRAVALELVTIPMQHLNPLNPPTATPTITPTARISPTSTVTLTPSPMPTETPVPSPTPLPAFIVSSRGADVYDAPGGNFLFKLPQNAAVWLNAFSAQQLERDLWVEVRDNFGRSGWLLVNHLDIDPDMLPTPQ